MSNHLLLLEKYLLRLCKLQNGDGSFSHESFTKRGKQGISYTTTFFTSLITQCLFVVPENPYRRRVVESAKKFLISQKEKNGAYAYWAKGQCIPEALKYPPDLDDTMAASTALLEGKILSPKKLSELLKLLVACEEREGGPYRTWCTHAEDKQWKDIDVVVNANISFFCSLYDISLPNITEYIDQSIEKENIFSPYYPSFSESLSVLYFLARGYKGKKKEKLISLLLLHRDINGGFGNTLNTALAISSLLRLGYKNKDLKKSIKYLYDHQDEWKAYSFCCDPVLEKEQYYAGSEALTIALCLEALCLYKKEKEGFSVAQESCDPLFVIVIERISARFNTLPSLARTLAQKFLEKIITSRRAEEIVLLPYFFYKGLSCKENIPEEKLVTLCVANVYGWMAYTMYDDMVDGEGEEKLLPIANICFRECIKIFLSFPLDQEYVSGIFDTLECATVWEITHCRKVVNGFLPEYPHVAFLADRSLGHMLSCIGVLFLLKYKKDSKEVKMIEDFFKYYLAAKQLDDELHDWKEDLLRGQLNYVSTFLIKEYKKECPSFIFSLSPKALHTLEEFFWQKSMPSLVRVLMTLAEKAKKYLNSASSFGSFEYLKKLCTEIEASGKKTLEEQRQTLEFLFAFSKNKTPSQGRGFEKSKD